jgi:hypothetical protein
VLSYKHKKRKMEDRTIKTGDNKHSYTLIPVGLMYTVLYKEYNLLHELLTNGQSYACTVIFISK